VSVPLPLFAPHDTPARPKMMAEDLIAFETMVADAFNNSLIRAPVHLAKGNEEQVIKLFEGVCVNDWICTQWRSHYHCLLKGVPQDRLMADILKGKSITLTYPDYRVISSAIVGGIIPIALGLAWSIKRQKLNDRVFVFVGDMTAMTGIFHECHRYAIGFRLPISFVVEDNGKSVETSTRRSWGRFDFHSVPVIRYNYELGYPHAGAGRRVQF
jgi:TPP-dependent pyruvate/acetoin dehydrogenase alpha subunit